MTDFLTTSTWVPSDAAPFTWPWAAVFWLVVLAVQLAEWPALSRLQELPSAQWPADLISGGRLLRVSVLLALLLSWFGILSPGGDWPGTLFATGIVLMVTAGLMRRHCMRMLGGDFTLDLRAKPDQTIIQSGAYAVLRHPSYLAGMTFFLGFGLASGSLAASGLLLAVSCFVYVRRINDEERLLLDVLGEKYRQYTAGRKRMIPFIY
jgi:protein-S-isoprenylcysteine O-methyltransferase Ste14